MTELTDNERYADFLIQEWAHLKGKSLIPEDGQRSAKTGVLEHTIGQVADTPGLRLEFGVWQGKSIRLCADAQKGAHWFGFDSFEGFPDDGRIDWQKPFKVIELPDTPSNVTLVKGYFSETLDPFLADTPGEVAFVNVDCDIYSSTVDVFTALEKHGRLKPGLVIFFDELINYVDYMWNESRALWEMLERTGFGIEWIAYDHKLRQPEESVRHFFSGDHPTWMDDLRAGYWQQASLRLTGTGLAPGPRDDAEYRKRLGWMLEGMAAREAQREAEYAARQERLAEQARIREEREVERKRQNAERAEQRRLERQREREAEKRGG